MPAVVFTAANKGAHDRQTPALAAVERSPEDLREIGNYVVALEYGVERLMRD